MYTNNKRNCRIKNKNTHYHIIIILCLKLNVKTEASAPDNWNVLRRAVFFSPCKETYYVQLYEPRATT